MKIKSSQLIEDLIRQTKLASATVSGFKSLDVDELNFKQTPDSWSILECIEHLNLYGNFYLPEIERQILAQRPISGDAVFKSGLIGDYFVNLTRVHNGKIRKMKTPLNMDPIYSRLSDVTLSRFLKQQELLLSLLEQSLAVDLSRTRTSISLTPLLKLRLGDTLRFMVAHIDRHIQQACRTQF